MQHPGDAAEVPGAEVADRVIRMLSGDLFQSLDLFIHLKALWKAMIEHVIRQHAQAGGDGLRVPADHRFGMAAFHQLLHLFRLMQADRNMLLQIQPHLKRPQQALMIVALVSGQHMHLLIALGNQIDHFLLAGEQRRQGGRGIGMLGQQAVFGFTVIRQLPVKQAKRLP